MHLLQSITCSYFQLLATIAIRAMAMEFFKASLYIAIYPVLGYINYDIIEITLEY